MQTRTPARATARTTAATHIDHVMGRQRELWVSGTQAGQARSTFTSLTERIHGGLVPVGAAAEVPLSLAGRDGAEIAVLEWTAQLVGRGSRTVDMVVIGTKRAKG